jgi:hypothetical protein
MREIQNNAIVPNVPKTAASGSFAAETLENTERYWSGREDLNLRHPGPETKKISQGVDF